MGSHSRTSRSRARYDSWARDFPISDVLFVSDIPNPVIGSLSVTYPDRGTYFDAQHRSLRGFMRLVQDSNKN